MKSFDVPVHYRSPIISKIKAYRKAKDRMKKDFSPSVLSLDSRLEIIISRHFGFCYGVENAIEIAFKAVKENKGKRIFLLSEMIHNPQVNGDLIESGVQFIMDTKGNQLIDWDTITQDDIVIIPAFGTTLEIEQILKDKGIEPQKYNTTCPFVEKVWTRSEKIGEKGYTVVVHGKSNHEETRATFSHADAHTPTIIVKDMSEAVRLGEYIDRTRSLETFFEDFGTKCSQGFDPEIHLERIGVVNQTTMLASETQAIADHLKQVVVKYKELKEDAVKSNFADTRDTLCYATNDNQSAVKALLDTEAELALVIGGYNSSNTSHLVELCEEVLPTYFINDASCIEDDGSIQHFDLHSLAVHHSKEVLNFDEHVRVLVTSGASCPDALVEGVIKKLARLYHVEGAIENSLALFSLED